MFEWYLRKYKNDGSKSIYEWILTLKKNKNLDEVFLVSKFQIKTL
jgi:hypothetical protein